MAMTYPMPWVENLPAPLPLPRPNPLKKNKQLYYKIIFMTYTITLPSSSYTHYSDNIIIVPNGTNIPIQGIQFPIY